MKNRDISRRNLLAGAAGASGLVVAAQGDVEAQEVNQNRKQIVDSLFFQNPIPPEGGWPEGHEFNTLRSIKLNNIPMDRKIGKHDEIILDLRVNPKANPSLDPPSASFTLPFGYGFCFLRTSGKTWSFHYANWGLHGPEGVNAPAGESYYLSGTGVRAGLLCGSSTAGTVKYSKEFDRSEGGEYFYHNSVTMPHTTIPLYINDWLTRGYYDDNAGYMECTVLIKNLEQFV